MIAQDEVKRLILQALPDARLELTDLTGTQDHYEAKVVSQAFAGRSALEQHRMVYGALGPAMEGPVHALALRTFTPDAWARRQGGAT